MTGILGAIELIWKDGGDWRIAGVKSCTSIFKAFLSLVRSHSGMTWDDKF